MLRSPPHYSVVPISVPFHWLNQFHDILPGSSIDEVYVESARQYAEVFKVAEALRGQALRWLAARVDTRGKGRPVVAFNSLSWERRAVVETGAGGLRLRTAYVAAASDGTVTPVQIGHDGRARFAGRLPSVGHAVFHVRPGRAGGPAVTATPRSLENDWLRVSFDRRGQVRRIFDKRARRDVLEPGRAGNQFQLFEDKPVALDAWEVDLYYNDKPLDLGGTLTACRVLEQGPVRAVVRFERVISRSRITQDVVLTAGSPRLDFVTTVAWGDEKDVLLKVAFPVNVCAEKGRHGIQFGHVERPTHWNTPRDFGMFEVPAQKWVDLSEGDYGVALLNDCKYGHDVRGNVMRLTLLRAPKTPGLSADVRKAHTFTYAILPHAGVSADGVARGAYELNVPALALRAKPHAGSAPPFLSRLSVTGEGVIIETVKKAEDDDGIIVRLYEARGARGRCTLRTTLPVRAAVETDLMERPERRLPVRNGAVALYFRPFQIRTLKLRCG